jgi:hypothetical protein
MGVKRLVIVASLMSALIVLNTARETRGAGPKRPSPPQSNAFGKSLAEWLVLHQTWYIEGSDPAGEYVGHVLLLPQPQGIPTPVVPGSDLIILKGSLDLELNPGTPIVVPIITLVGETYVNPQLPPDFPLDSFKASLLGAEVRVTLDGKPLVDGASSNLGNFFIGPTYFKPPIAYDPPQFRFSDPLLGDVYAASAIWLEALGFVLEPLSVGPHVLRIFAVNHDLSYGFDNTWNITVHP